MTGASDLDEPPASPDFAEVLESFENFLATNLTVQDMVGGGSASHMSQPTDINARTRRAARIPSAPEQGLSASSSTGESTIIELEFRSFSICFCVALHTDNTCEVAVNAGVAEQGRPPRSHTGESVLTKFSNKSFDCLCVVPDTEEANELRDEVADPTTSTALREVAVNMKVTEQSSSNGPHTALRSEVTEKPHDKAGNTSPAAGGLSYKDRLEEAIIDSCIGKYLRSLQEILLFNNSNICVDHHANVMAGHCDEVVNSTFMPEVVNPKGTYLRTGG